MTACRLEFWVTKECTPREPKQGRKRIAIMPDRGVGAGTVCLHILLQHRAAHVQVCESDSIRVQFRSLNQGPPCCPETLCASDAPPQVLLLHSAAGKNGHTEYIAQQMRETYESDPAAESGSLRKEPLFGGVRLPSPM